MVATSAGDHTWGGWGLERQKRQGPCEPSLASSLASGPGMGTSRDSHGDANGQIRRWCLRLSLVCLSRFAGELAADPHGDPHGPKCRVYLSPRLRQTRWLVAVSEVADICRRRSWSQWAGIPNGTSLECLSDQPGQGAKSRSSDGNRGTMSRLLESILAISDSQQWAEGFTCRK